GCFIAALGAGPVQAFRGHFPEFGSRSGWRRTVDLFDTLGLGLRASVRHTSVDYTDARKAPADRRLRGRFSHDSLRRRGALLDPFAEPLGEIGVRQRRLRAAIARFPAPQDQLILRDVLQQLL